MMEERLGRFGRPVTTAFILLVVLGASIWMIDIIYTTVVRQVPSAFFIECVSLNIVDILVVYGIGSIVCTAVVIAVNRFELARAKRIIERHKKAAESSP